MKKWKLILLEIEKIIRWLAIIFGSLFSFMAFCQIVWLYIADNAASVLYKTIPNNSLSIIVFVVKSILPLLLSIFILIATRKFKELNLLIVENKNL